MQWSAIDQTVSPLLLRQVRYPRTKAMHVDEHGQMSTNIWACWMGFASCIVQIEDGPWGLLHFVCATFLQRAGTHRINLDIIKGLQMSSQSQVHGLRVVEMVRSFNQSLYSPSFYSYGILPFLYINSYSNSSNWCFEVQIYFKHTVLSTENIIHSGQTLRKRT